MLEIIVTTYIDKHQLLPSSGEVIIAVSGGANSLCLLHLLNQLCGTDKRYPEVRLHAAHLNHKLRGEASDQDAATVAGIVKSWGLECTSGEVDVAELARVERRSLEMRHGARATAFCVKWRRESQLLSLTTRMTRLRRYYCISCAAAD